MSSVISFKDIYTKAIGLFDDPKITAAYNSNLIQFYKLMYVYLQNSISLFNNPLSVMKLISNFEEPTGQMEIFEADGISKEFELDSEFQIKANSSYEYIANGERVNAKFNKDTRTVIFEEVLPIGQQYSFEQYSIGKIECDLGDNGLSTMVQINILNCIKDILARLLVKTWGENTRNFLLDIQNILTDSDFNVHSASSALKAKNEWLNQLDREILQYQNKLAWNIRMLKG